MSLSNEQTKQIMLKMFPKKQEPQYQPPRIQYNPTMFEQMNGYNKVSNNIKKWYVAIMISMFGVFLLSSFSLNFIDDFCAKQNIEAFDHKGDPKIILTSVLFLFLFVFVRIVLMLL